MKCVVAAVGGTLLLAACESSPIAIEDPDDGGNGPGFVAQPLTYTLVPDFTDGDTLFTRQGIGFEFRLQNDNAIGALSVTVSYRLVERYRLVEETEPGVLAATDSTVELVLREGSESLTVQDSADLLVETVSATVAPLAIAHSSRTYELLLTVDTLSRPAVDTLARADSVLAVTQRAMQARPSLSAHVEPALVVRGAARFVGNAVLQSDTARLDSETLASFSKAHDEAVQLRFDVENRAPFAIDDTVRWQVVYPERDSVSTELTGALVILLERTDSMQVASGVAVQVDAGSTATYTLDWPDPAGGRRTVYPDRFTIVVDRDQVGATFPPVGPSPIRSHFTFSVPGGQ